MIIAIDRLLVRFKKSLSKIIAGVKGEKLGESELKTGWNEVKLESSEIWPWMTSSLEEAWESSVFDLKSGDSYLTLSDALGQLFTTHHLYHNHCMQWFAFSILFSTKVQRENAKLMLLAYFGRH